MHREVAPVDEPHSFGAAEHPADLSDQVRLGYEGRKTQGEAGEKRHQEPRGATLIHGTLLGSASSGREVLWTSNGRLS